MATIEIKLYVTNTFKVSDKLKELNTNDTEMLLSYGESLLKCHYEVINNKILSDETNQLMKSLQLKSDELQTLKNICDTDMIKYKNDLVLETKKIRLELSDNHTNNLEIIKQEYDSYKLKLKLKNDELQNLNDEYCNDKIKYKNDVDNETKKIILELNNNQTNAIAIMKQEYDSYNLILQKRLDDSNDMYKRLTDTTYAANIDNLNMFKNYKIEFQADLEKAQLQSKEFLNLSIEKEQISNKCVIDQLKLIHNEQVSDLKCRIDAAANELKEREKCLINVEKIVKYYEITDNSTKGNLGENKVQEIIKSYYSAADITDMSGIPHSGDLHLNLCNIKCLIEIKNKKNIIDDDVNKFLSDIESRGELINCGIFISLLSSNIPKKGSFYIEMKNSIPLIYVYSIDNNTIHFAIETMLFLTNINATIALEDRSDTKILDIAIEKLYASFSTLQFESNRINIIIGHLEKQVNSLKLSKKNLILCIDDITTFYTKYNTLDLIKKNKKNNNDDTKESIEAMHDYSDSEILKLNTWIVENKKIPIKNEVMDILNLSKNDIRKRNFSTLRVNMKTYFDSLKK